MPRIGRYFMPNMKRGAMGFMQSGDFPVPMLHLKFGENTGNALADSSPEGNDGVNHGATWTKGYLGPGLSFDGKDDYVRVNKPILTAATKVTIEWWMKIPVQVASWKSIFYDATGGISVYFTTDGTNGLYGDIGDSVRGWVMNKPDLTDAWHHCVVIADSVDGVIKSYLNGAYQSQTANAAFSTITLDDLYLFTEPAVKWTKGLLDEVRIYDVVLTARQILERFHGIE